MHFFFEYSGAKHASKTILVLLWVHRSTPQLMAGGAEVKLLLSLFPFDIFWNLSAGWLNHDRPRAHYSKS